MSLQLQDIQRAIGDRAVEAAAFHDALSEYASTYYYTYIEPTNAGPQLSSLQQSCERLKGELAGGRMVLEQAVGKAKSEGIWTDEFDSLIGRELIRQIDESSIDGRDKAQLKKLVRKSDGARANLEKGLALLPQMPEQLDRQSQTVEAAALKATGTESALSASLHDYCGYWFVMFWMCWFFAIVVTTGTGGAAWPVFGLCAIPALIALYWCSRAYSSP